MDKVIIRPFKPSDAADLTSILYEAVHSIGARDYTPAQLWAWSPTPMSPQDYLVRVADGRTVLVALGAVSRAVAFIELEEDGYIDCLYCHFDFAGRGIAEALFISAEFCADAAGISHLSVDASEAARRFFLREGFEISARREFQLRGVQIHNYAMHKKLR